MKPKHSLSCPKQPETGFYIELDKSTSRIIPDFIKVEFSIIIRRRLGPRFVTYLLALLLQLCVQIYIHSMCFKSWQSCLQLF
jgi:hypothetical protein